MPELPEVETVRRGLAPVLTGATILRVDQRRPDLRFPFPPGLRERLEGARIEDVGRRAKFLVFPLSSGETMLAHLGMTGRFSLHAAGGGPSVEPGAFYAPAPPRGHEHLEIGVAARDGSTHRLVFSDPRRFGFIELFATKELPETPRMAALGPEPLGEGFTPGALTARLAGKGTPIKSALLDQGIVAGLGNIYVCEALFRAGISPRRLARSIGPKRAARLVPVIRQVLEEAIEAGGSTLRDYAAADGSAGSFQQRFLVYDRAGESCPSCGSQIARIVQSGRSTFFCGRCQR